MCNKKSPPPPSHDDHVQRSSVINTMIKQEDKDEEQTLKPRAARKSRTKTRKPKFSSLRSKLIQDQSNQRVPDTKTMTATASCHGHQLNLLPFHPENLVDHESQEKADMQNDNVALLFHSDGGSTLNGLLTPTATSTTTMSSDREDQESFSTYACYRGGEEYYGDSHIVRTAMRSREREMSVEKWVCYSELVHKKEDIVMEDCSTSTTTTANVDDDRMDPWFRSKVKGESLLALKLDHQEILNAWSDQGPLYIDGEPPQTFPDLLQQMEHQPFQLHHNTPNPNGCSGNLWKVPEEDSRLKTKTVQREASVLRYKEKRQSRLFSKQIRYQVRKLNAEKRPRMKGRFVKRN